MKTVLKYAAAVALTGALALAAATPSEARHGRNAAAGIGFVAGALVGAAVVNNGYYGGPGYAMGRATLMNRITPMRLRRSMWSRHRPTIPASPIISVARAIAHSRQHRRISERCSSLTSMKM